MALLEIRDLSIRFGGLVAVNGVNLDIKEGEITGLIGPNGAGKTTVFNMITGVYQPSGGSITFTGQDITGKKLVDLARLGVVRTFQNIRLFKSLTVYENIRTAAHGLANYNMIDAFLHTPRYAKEEANLDQKTEELLALLGLTSVRNEISSSLPYGWQRRLEIARALALRPKLLLLDEPAAGMNHHETAELKDFIREIKRKFGVTILMIEHHMDIVMDLCDKIYVLNFGQLLAQGTPAEIQNDPRVIEAYLGEEELDDDAAEN